MKNFLNLLFHPIKNYLYNLNNFDDVRKFAPNETGIYMFRKDNQVKYIGSAIKNGPDCQNGIRQKLNEHWIKGPADLYNNRDDIYVVLRVCETKEEAKLLEEELIEKYKTKEIGWN